MFHWYISFHTAGLKSGAYKLRYTLSVGLFRNKWNLHTNSIKVVVQCWNTTPKRRQIRSLEVTENATWLEMSQQQNGGQKCSDCHVYSSCGDKNHTNIAASAYTLAPGKNSYDEDKEIWECGWVSAPSTMWDNKSKEFAQTKDKAHHLSRQKWTAKWNLSLNTFRKCQNSKEAPGFKVHGTEVPQPKPAVASLQRDEVQ